MSDQNTPSTILDQTEYKNELNDINTLDVETQITSILNQESLDGVPSIYVDANILNPSEINAYIKKVKKIVYEINGTIFQDETNLNELCKDTDKLLEFEIIDEVSKQTDNDKFAATEAKEFTQTSDLNQRGYDKATGFHFTIDKTPYGLVINSNILLTENAWNTIICDDHTICIACNKSLDVEEIAGHITSDNHKYILNIYKPLEEFEHNIVRQIDDVYHCAVCNITFGINDKEHLESASHGETFLKSINKVMDITADKNSDSGRNGNRNDDNDCCHSNAIVEDSSGFDSESFDGFYDDVSVNYCDESETDNEDNRNELPIISYADIAKKPKTYTTSKYVQIKHGDLYAKVTFDSWNMIIILKTNEFYCMACKNNGPIRHKSDHCLQLSHVENLQKCIIVRDYENHVIRKVDNKLYHCGHCNNLYMVHEIGGHIETKHIKRNTPNVNITDTEPTDKHAVKKNATYSQIVSDNDDKYSGSVATRSAGANPVVADNESKITGNKRNDNDNVGTSNALPKNLNSIPYDTVKVLGIAVHRNMNNEKHDLPQINRVPNQAFAKQHPTNIATENNKFFIKVFGQTYCISPLAYNLIQQRGPDTYFCLVCDVWCVNGVWNHISEPRHTLAITLMPFLPQTSFHLIRQTKYGFHCAVCNFFIFHPNPINHTWDYMHLNLLQKIIVPSLTMPAHQIGTPIFYGIKTTPPTESRQVAETKSDQKKPETTEANFENRNNDKLDIANNENRTTETVGDKDFDTEECIYVKLKNVYTKITRTAYNTLVQTGNGARFCVLCTVDVFNQDLKTHVSSPSHLRNMDKYKFLEKYEKHLLRQADMCYHCALCNVCVNKNFLNDHISWQYHKEIESNKIVKHIRRNEIKSGIEEIACLTQKDIVTDTMKDEFQVLLNIEFRLHGTQDIVKKKKIVKLNKVILKLSWDGFHGICKNKIGYKCLICQADFKSYELSAHIEGSRHLDVLENNFCLEFLPAVIRKVNDTTLHCLTCNQELKNDKHGITGHKNSKQHLKKYTASVADITDTDIDDNDMLVLQKIDSNNKKKPQ